MGVERDGTASRSGVSSVLSAWSASGVVAGPAGMAGGGGAREAYQVLRRSDLFVSYLNPLIRPPLHLAAFARRVGQRGCFLVVGVRGLHGGWSRGRRRDSQGSDQASGRGGRQRSDPAPLYVGGRGDSRWLVAWASSRKLGRGDRAA